MVIMKKSNYISIKDNVTGFSFANLGIFTGFGGGLVATVYSLVLLDILGSGAMVGLYSSIYNVFGFLVALFFGEFMRIISKSKLFYSSLLSVAIIFFMMGFDILPRTFITLDFFSLIPMTFIATLIPLFLAEFAGKNGIANLNGRYILWLNVGWLFAPVIAMMIADLAGLRSVFIFASFVYFLALFIFKRYGIIEIDKKIPKVTPKKTIRSICRETNSYFSNKAYARAYIVNFGFFALRTLRALYVPIVVFEAGFSKDTLGLILTIGIIPYIILAEPVGRLAKKYGQYMTNGGMAFGFIIYAICSFLAYFVGGSLMLCLFVIWQIPGAIKEALHDLVFFDVAKGNDKTRFFGIFNTSKNLPRIFTPLVATLFILMFGSTNAVWLLSGIIACASTVALLYKKYN